MKPNFGNIFVLLAFGLAAILNMLASGNNPKSQGPETVVPFENSMANVVDETAVKEVTKPKLYPGKCEK